MAGTTLPAMPTPATHMETSDKPIAQPNLEEQDETRKQDQRGFWHVFMSFVTCGTHS